MSMHTIIRRTRFAGLLIGAIVAVGFLTASAQAAADANGTWKWKRAGQDGQEFELSLALKADGEKLTGTLTLPQGNEAEIKDGSFKNDEVAFAVMLDFNGNSLTIKYKGKVEGDTIKGKSEVERDGETRSRDWEAKREKK